MAGSSIPAKQTDLNAKFIEDITVLKVQLESQRDATKSLADLNTRVAILEKQVEEMQKAKEVWGQRGWTIFIALFSALLSLLSGVITAFLIAHLKK